MLTRQFVETPYGTKLDYYLDDESIYSTYLQVGIAEKKKQLIGRFVSLSYAFAIGILAVFLPG